MIPYSTIETLKNGMFLKTKYQSHSFSCPIPHIIVAANFMPNKHITNSRVFEDGIWKDIKTESEKI